jgi:predicted nuclease of predicted toxin-antitoxin system
VADLLADENFEDDVVDALVALGHDAITARAAGLTGTPDPDVLAHAHAQGRIVLTHDQDYQKLHKSGVPHAGIVYASVDKDFAALAARIDAALAAVPAPAGQLIRVIRPNPPTVP